MSRPSCWRKCSSALALLVLVGCDYRVEPSVVQLPAETPARALSSGSAPASQPTAELYRGVLSLRGSGVVEVPPSAFCDAAQAVLGDALGVPFTCAGTGVLSIVHPVPDPASLMALYVATVERMGGRVFIKGQGVQVLGPEQGGEATGVASDSGALLGDPVPGLDAFTLSDASASTYASASQLVGYERRGLVRPVRDSADRANVEGLVAELGLDLRTVDFGGRAFVIGDELSLATFDAFSGLGEEAVVPVAAAGISEAAIAAYSASYPGVSFNMDAPSGTLFLGGLPNDVAVAVAALRQVQPVTSRVRIEGLLVAYDTGQLRSLETALSVAAQPLALDQDAFGVSNGATLGLPFELVVDQVERAEFVQVVARPAVTATFGLPAEFRSGGEVAVLSGVDPETGRESVSYRPVGLTTRFTATPLLGDLVRLTMELELSSVEGSGVRANPSFDVRSVSTTVDLRRGDTVLLSGLAELSRSSSRGRSFGLPSSAGSASERSLGVFVTLR